MACATFDFAIQPWEGSMKTQHAGLVGGLLAAGLLWSGLASADQNCYSVRYSTLKHALEQAVEDEGSGLNLQMWATVVNRDGTVCAVAFSGVDRGAQWPGSRVISAQKANTANAFSLDSSSAIGHDSGAPTGLALSTANLYSPVQPGGSLFGLQESNPVDTGVAYKGPAENYGQQNDPMVGNRIGGVNVFGGGLALYSSQQRVVGAVGVSGDTSCADHRIAWRVRNLLGFDHLLGVGGVSGDPAHPDNIIYLGPGEAPNGFKHPDCGGGDDPGDLPPVQS